MNQQEFFRNISILFLILVVGLGMAAALTSLAQAGSRTVQRTGNVPVPGQFQSPSTLPVSAQTDQAPNPAPNILRVAKSGDGSDGSSWEKAYKTLNDALGNAGSGDEIWVATGVYTPGNSRSDSFKLIPETAVFGGFSAGDTSRTDRNWEKNITVLSGDIDWDDHTDKNYIVSGTQNINGGNSYHVVLAGDVLSDTILDGFIVTAGHADGTSPDNSGAGFYCAGDANFCSPSLENIIFSGNLAASKGGGMFNDGSSGGKSNPILNNVHFINNSAYEAGAIYNNAFQGTSNPKLTDVSFVGNYAEQTAGAMYNRGSTGGESNPLITNAIFAGNSSDGLAGAVRNHGLNGESSPNFINVLFSGNKSGTSGGAVFNYGNNGISSPKFTNVTFSGNAAQEGGAMYNSGYNGASSPELTNATFSGNSTGESGGAISSDGTIGLSSTKMRNSILWNNQDSTGTGTISATIFNRNASITLTNSLGQGTGGSNSWLTDTSYINDGGNIDIDPLFIKPVTPSDAPTTAGNLRLQIGSPAIDVGNDLFVISVPQDLAGAARIKDGDGDGTAFVDMGAFEVVTLFELAVAKTGTGKGVVTSIPPSIDCGEDCDVFAPEFSVYTLTVVPDPGSYFTGWSGDCTGSETCVVKMDKSRKVNANFDEELQQVFLPIIFR